MSLNYRVEKEKIPAFKNRAGTKIPAIRLWNCDTLLCKPVSNFFIDLVAYLAEFFQFLLVRPLKSGRVLEGPVHAGVHAWPDSGTILVGVVADSNEILEQHFAQVGIDSFGSLPGNIDPFFCMT